MFQQNGFWSGRSWTMKANGRGRHQKGMTSKRGLVGTEIWSHYSPRRCEKTVSPTRNPWPDNGITNRLAIIAQRVCRQILNRGKNQIICNSKYNFSRRRVTLGTFDSSEGMAYGRKNIAIGSPALCHFRERNHLCARNVSGIFSRFLFKRDMECLGVLLSCKDDFKNRLMVFRIGLSFCNTQYNK